MVAATGFPDMPGVDADGVYTLSTAGGDAFFFGKGGA
jgi:hypothetical protein